jgi:hypothetical protein
VPGAVACQLMDAAHPKAVPMHKVNFEARMLQDVFTKLKITQVRSVLFSPRMDEILLCLLLYCSWHPITLLNGRFDLALN